MTAPATSDRSEALWLLPASPMVWALHFLLSYATAALWCGKFGGPGAPLDTARLAILGYTLVALAAVAAIGIHGYRRHRFGGSPPPHDRDLPEDRHRFLGFATVLLSGMSAIAILYAVLVVVFLEGCD
jgi:hypothetical protein